MFDDVQGFLPGTFTLWCGQPLSGYPDVSLMSSHRNRKWPRTVVDFAKAPGLAGMAVVIPVLSLLAQSSKPPENAIPLQVIIVRSQEDAVQIVGRLKNGEDFGSIAREKSIDPTAHGRIWNADPKGWHLLSGPPPEVNQICNKLGMSFWPDEGLMTHSLHTIPIDRSGNLAANLEGNKSPRNNSEILCRPCQVTRAYDSSAALRPANGSRTIQSRRGERPEPKRETRPDEARA
jgi:hypothetical protein